VTASSRSVADLAGTGPDTALNAALAKAQAAFPPVKRTRQVDVETKTGGHYSYRYAALEDILAAVRPHLAEHGLALTQVLDHDAAGAVLRTELRHVAGGLIGGAYPLEAAGLSAQELGSLITYVRRYAVTALLGIATEDDDDGQAAGPAKADKPRGRGRRAGGSKLPEDVRPTEDQIRQMNAVLSDLYRMDPAIEWTETARRIAGVDGSMLTRAGAENVLHELGVILAQLVAEHGPPDYGET